MFARRKRSRYCDLGDTRVTSRHRSRAQSVLRIISSQAAASAKTSAVSVASSNRPKKLCLTTTTMKRGSKDRSAIKASPTRQLLVSMTAKHKERPSPCRVEFNLRHTCWVRRGQVECIPAALLARTATPRRAPPPCGQTHGAQKPARLAAQCRH